MGGSPGGISRGDPPGGSPEALLELFRLPRWQSLSKCPGPRCLIFRIHMPPHAFFQECVFSENPVGMCWNVLECVGMCRNVLECVGDVSGMCRNVSGMCWNVLECVCICLGIYTRISKGVVGNVSECENVLESPGMCRNSRKMPEFLENRIPEKPHAGAYGAWDSQGWKQTGWRTNEWRTTTPNDAEMTEQPGDNADPGSSSAEPRVP